jgi:hypothetical protein
VIGRWLAIAGGVTLAVALAAAAGRWSGHRAGVAAEVARAERAAADLARKAETAREAAGLSRASDMASTLDAQEAAEHAIQSVPSPDARPSDRSVALNCERLRHAGGDPARVPACRGLARPSRTDPAP